jgi:hypothetical protein
MVVGHGNCRKDEEEKDEEKMKTHDEKQQHGNGGCIDLNNTAYRETAML